MRKVSLDCLGGERIIGYSRSEYPEYHAWLASLFVPLAPPAIVEEHESSLSLIAALEAGRGVALIAQGLESLAGSRLKIRALNPAPAPVVVGVAYRKEKTSAAIEKFVAALKRAKAAG
jgi:DNA-binding transcriptional LysR family regulator